jgi:hypothetical protein
VASSTATPSRAQCDRNHGAWNSPAISPYPADDIIIGYGE